MPHQPARAAAGGIVSDLERLEIPYLSGRHLLLSAGIQAALGSAEVAMATLRRAVADGQPFGVEFHSLPVFRPLRSRADFRALLHPRD